MTLALIVLGALTFLVFLPFAIEPGLGYEPDVPLPDEDKERS